MVSLLQWRDGVEGQTFNGLYVTDSLAHLLKVASYIAVAATWCMAASMRSSAT